MSIVNEFSYIEMIQDVKIVEHTKKDGAGTWKQLCIVLSDGYEIQLFLDRAELKILELLTDQHIKKSGKTILDE